MSNFEVAALRYAAKFEPQAGDSMPLVTRQAWVAAIEYARSMGEDDNSMKVDFAIHCDGRTDLDAAWEEWA